MSRRGIKWGTLPKHVQKQVEEQCGPAIQPSDEPPETTQYLTLPFPPSVNNMYATVRGRRVLSANGKAYKQHVRSECLASGARPISGPVWVGITWHPPDNRVRDVDNPVKALLDALKHAGVLADDSQVRRLLVEFGDVYPSHGKAMVLVGRM